MKRSLVHTLLVLLMLATLPAAAQMAPPSPPGPGAQPGGGLVQLGLVLRAIDLEPAQRAQIDPLLRARREAAEADRPAADAAERALAEQVLAGTFDEAAIRAAAASVAEFAADRAIADAALLRGIRALLTPAQRETFDRLLGPPPNRMRRDGDEVPS